MNRSSSYVSLLASVLIIALIACTGNVPVPAPVDPPVVETEKPTDPDPLRYPDALEAFRTADSLNPSEPGVLLFVGSSSIRGWKTLAEDLSDYNVLNRGFGGSHFSDLIYHVESLVFSHEPGAIFVYEGDNDIAWGKSPERVYQDYLKFVQMVREKWASTPIYFIAVKPSIARISMIDEMAKANALILDHTKSDETLHFVDVFSVMVDESGQPKEEIFGHDGLHMNALGYDLWEAAVKEALRK
ncbi:MAG: hypothetical protein K9M49_09545 [Candidatus Marinimicrobia bacterium]|nr:hypothetical protein [Candidatus Neomarinimicrobiota bacterium]MCF7850816.1 hypothetical protein [Candidatus Neomarinimicrobiota bacterium]MCF7905376.1 hypothetical protein [Candidatus Neomarinimicrobiota bacterium]